jgi:hypothetical protein
MAGGTRKSSYKEKENGNNINDGFDKQDFEMERTYESIGRVDE